MFWMLEQERTSLNKEQQKEQTDKILPGMSGTSTFVFSIRCHDSMFPQQCERPIAHVSSITQNRFNQRGIFHGRKANERQVEGETTLWSSCWSWRIDEIGHMPSCEREHTSRPRASILDNRAGQYVTITARKIIPETTRNEIDVNARSLFVSPPPIRSRYASRRSEWSSFALKIMLQPPRASFSLPAGNR